MSLKPYFVFVLILFTISLFAQEDKLLNEAKEKAKSEPVWHYPYPELVNHLREEGKTSIPIFSYGSLMDTGSASRTLGPESLATRKPAIAYGIRRVFDRDVPIRVSPNWCLPNDPEARGMLNVLPTNSSVDFTNGVLLDVVLDDLPKVLAREDGYDLMPVVVQEWDVSTQANKSGYKIAYTFHAPQHSSYTSETIHPRPGYYELTRNAAKQFGPLYSLLWFQTTYFADGKTPIIEWEKQVDNHEPQTEAVCTEKEK